jgi:hypothetical protein
MFNKLVEKLFELQEKEDGEYFYHLAAVNYGPVLKLAPRVPGKGETLEGEDTTTPRISLAPSVIKAIRALGPFMIPLSRVLWVYKISKNKAGSVYIPNEDEIPDVEETDEVWSKHSLSLVGDMVIKANYTTTHYEEEKNPTFKIVGGPEKFRESPIIKGSLSRGDVEKLYSYQPGDIIWTGSKDVWIERVRKGQLIREIDPLSSDFKLYQKMHDIVYWTKLHRSKKYWVMKLTPLPMDFGFKTSDGKFIKVPYIIIGEDDIVELVDRPDIYDTDTKSREEQQFLKEISPILQKEYFTLIKSRE